jgi:hypothetical protein
MHEHDAIDVVRLLPRSTWRVRLGQSSSEADDGWLIVKNLPYLPNPHTHPPPIALMHKYLTAWPPTTSSSPLFCCRYTADEAAVSLFFQSSPLGSVKVDSFSPVKKGAMNTGDAIVRVGKGLGACLQMNVRLKRLCNSKPSQLLIGLGF